VAEQVRPLSLTQVILIATAKSVYQTSSVKESAVAQQLVQQYLFGVFLAALVLLHDYYCTSPLPPLLLLLLLPQADQR
jgi:hypothetical protein